MKRFRHITGVLLCCFGCAGGAVLGSGNFGPPIASDKRIRTVLYDDNEVTLIRTHPGYQTSIEFSRYEKIKTISLGDRSAWRLIPVGHRLYVRPRAMNAHTNLNVITNKRSYQFDLISGQGKGKPRNIAYVIRFYYPEEMDAETTDELFMSPAPSVVQVPSGIGISSMADMNHYRHILNFNYTFAGRGSITPSKVFDDGQLTYMQFFAPPPEVAVVDQTGRERPVNIRRQGDFVVVDTIASQFSLRANGELVCVFNEAMSSVRRHSSGQAGR